MCALKVNAVNLHLTCNVGRFQIVLTEVLFAMWKRIRITYRVNVLRALPGEADATNATVCDAVCQKEFASMPPAMAVLTPYPLYAPVNLISKQF